MVTVQDYEQRIAALEAKIQELTAQHTDSIAEESYSVEKFMTSQYPTIKRVPLKDVCLQYKKQFGIKLSQPAMTAQLKLLGFRVSSVGGKRYVNRN